MAVASGEIKGIVKTELFGDLLDGPGGFGEVIMGSFHPHLFEVGHGTLPKFLFEQSIEMGVAQTRDFDEILPPQGTVKIELHEAQNRGQTPSLPLGKIPVDLHEHGVQKR